MKNLISAIVFLTLFYAHTNAQGLESYNQPTEHQMPPKLIPTVRKYWVSLPKDYEENTNRYPVLFLFDGNEAYLRNLILFDVDQLTKLGEIPPCIIVGVMQRNRALDFGPLYAVKSNPNSDKVNGDKFFDFIKKELFPELQKNYRTQNFKIGIGHSLGGLFLLNSFTKDPDFFNGIIAVSPALEMNRIVYYLVTSKKHCIQKLISKPFFAGPQVQKVLTKWHSGLHLKCWTNYLRTSLIRRSSINMLICPERTITPHRSILCSMHLASFLMIGI